MPSAPGGPARNPDLDGNVPDESPVVVVVIDVINDLEWEDGEKIEAPALAMAHKLAPLLDRARHAGVPVIYANDNFGKWRSDFRALLEHCLDDDVRGRAIAELLRPGADDYFVLKPKHSAFFATTLDTLLTYLRARTLVLAGLTTDSCILATAVDADMRDYEVLVPRDCVAALSTRRNQRALDHLNETLDIRSLDGADIDFGALARRGPRDA
ncbi:MAG: cysteine hydrolase family protein [Gemmatimonadaceae bacterium]